MIRRFSLITAVAVLAIVLSTAAYVLRAPAEASETIAAIPLVQEQAAGSSSETTDAETATTAEADVQSAGEILFEINEDNAQAGFALGEVLRGTQTTVVGITDQVAGQISFDPADLSTVQIGIFRVDARTLATDSDMRDRAIQNEILDTGSYEYITFTPADVAGLPDSIGVGETISFTISGDLTIRDVTQPVTFAVTATFVSENELTGTASATIARDDYNLTIPSVPQVAGVDDAVEIIVDFAASA